MVTLLGKEDLRDTPFPWPLNSGQSKASPLLLERAKCAS